MASQLLLPPNSVTKSVTSKVFFTGDCQGLTRRKKPNQATRVSNGFSLRAKAALRSNHNNKSSVEIPNQWYNLVTDLSVKPPPPLHPKTFEPIKPEDLSHLFPNELIKQEASQERFIDIPEEVLEIYKLWRPTPLIRAKRLEKLLQTLI